MKEVLRTTITSEGKTLRLFFLNGQYYVAQSHFQYLKKFKCIHKAISFFEGAI